MPGSTPARERLVRDAVSYLGTLAREAQGDRSLQRELAGAYQRVGDVQGGTLTGNLGDTKGALESYGKSLRILEALFTADSSEARTRRDLARTATDMGKLLFDTGDVSGSTRLARRAWAALESLATDSTDPDLRLQFAATDDLLGVLLLETGDPRAAADRHRGAIRRLESAPEVERASPALRRALSVTHMHLGDAIEQLGDEHEALNSYQRARALRAALAADFPDNADYRQLLGASDFWIGTVLADQGRYREALQRFRSNLVSDSLAAGRDPKNAAKRSGVAFDLARIGDMLLKLDRPKEALATYQRTLAIRSEELRIDSANVFKRFQLIESRTSICRATAVLARPRADRECDRAAELMRGTTLEPTNAGYRGYLAGAYSDLAEVYDSVAARGAAAERHRRRAAALEFYRRSSEIWSDLQSRGLVNPTDTGRVGAAREAVARAEAAVRAP